MESEKNMRPICVIDARMIGESGIGTYIRHLLGHDLYQYALGAAEKITTADRRINVIDYREAIYGLKEQFTFPYLRLRRIKPDLLHIPHYNIPIFYTGKMIVTIHDLTHLAHPEFLPHRLAYLYARIMTWLAAHRALKILTVSEYTKRDIIRYLKVPADKVVVTYNGVDDAFHEKDAKQTRYLYKKYGIEPSHKLLLFVGNLKPHKNLITLFEACRLLDNKNDIRLTVIGRGFKTYDIEEKIKTYGLSDSVILTGEIAKDELIDWYNIADIFIFPSLYEGFGIPLLEAMACKTPVICSNCASIPEVAGDAAIQFEPLNAQDLSEKILQLLGDQELQAQLTEKGLMQCGKFQWDDTRDRTRRVIWDMVRGASDEFV